MKYLHGFCLQQYLAEAMWLQFSSKCARITSFRPSGFELRYKIGLFDRHGKYIENADLFEF